MKQITIRGIPDEILRIIEKEAKRKKLSMNKALISLFERATGIITKKEAKRLLYHDLGHLWGAWTKEEAASFMKSLEI